MNANEMTFGVEIETVAPDTAVESDGLRIGAYHHGIQVPYLPRGWKAERDGSIDASRGGHPCEIVSPVLKGAEGIAQVAAERHVSRNKTGRAAASATNPVRNQYLVGRRRRSLYLRG